VSPEQLLALLAPAPLLPVVRVSSSDEALAVARRLAGAGLPAVELTATTPGWADALAVLRAELPDLTVGVGTMTTAADAEQAVAGGAAFLVSPFPVPAVRPVAAGAGAAFLEGGCTPGELADAASRGIAKLFPAHLGGPAYLRSVLAVLPGARVVPTGGIRLEEVGEWLAAGAAAVGVGSDLTAPGDVVERVRRALATVRAA
jgi:2-dehydro-3-deoxyphosphogluconate aldolase/(4S)-4-hydroxy-2-oxoglutarate aldolase